MDTKKTMVNNSYSMIMFVSKNCKIHALNTMEILVRHFKQPSLVTGTALVTPLLTKQSLVSGVLYLILLQINGVLPRVVINDFTKFENNKRKQY